MNNEKICANCRHYEKGDFLPFECLNIKLIEMIKPDAGAGCSFEPPKDFGCSLFEEKENEKT